MSATAKSNSSVQMRKAYYSLLQFYPDMVRDERINIGVILEAPQYGYKAAKYLRYMDRFVKCLDPNVDVSLVRAVAQELENELRSKDPGPVLDSSPLFSDVMEPIKIQELQRTFNSATRSLWRIGDPQPLLIPARQRFDDRLNLLYDRLVARASEVKFNSWDKNHVKERVVKDLENRNVLLKLNPEPLSGSFYKENEFDAVYSNQKKTFIQFFSYDIETPDLNQLKVFLSSVEDLRSSGYYTSDQGFYYTAILQPPEHVRTEEASKKFSRAVNYLREKSISIFTPKNEHMERVAQAFHQNVDPIAYQPQSL